MRYFLLLTMLLLAGCGTDQDASLRLSRLLSDGVVVQRDAPIPVWGTAPRGSSVRITAGDEVIETRTGADGRWRAELSARPAGAAFAFSVSAAGRTIDVSDVLAGDVWIASGQSNMEWAVADAADADREIAQAGDAAIRHFKVPRDWSYEARDTLSGGVWETADPEHVGQFSAVAYYFAREVRRHVDVPIGIVNTTWGGSRIEPWMDRQALEWSEERLESALDMDRAQTDAVKRRLMERLGELPETDPGLVDGVARWADPLLDDQGWDTLPVPGFWEEAYPGMDGIAWYRMSFDLSAAEVQAGGVRIGLGNIDDSDISWLNGVEIGRTENAWQTARAYGVPDEALREGTNALAVRVVDTGGGGGIWGGEELLWLETSAGRRPLAGSWRFRVGAASVSVGSDKNQVATLLYNAMVHPLLPFPATGFLWYQGESNAGGPDAVAYADQFKAMISRWRTLWNAPGAPFLFVQLANYMQASDQPVESDWAVLRESQSASLALPGVAQAVIIDIGEADDIHPRNKQDVGLRLSLAARAIAYGQDVPFVGPTFRSLRVIGRRAVVTFDHADGGLVAPGGGPGGFAIAGADGRYQWASARIDGNTVSLMSPRVTTPVSVRYAWADNPDRANLYNGAGLPAVPFRTDGR